MRGCASQSFLVIYPDDGWAFPARAGQEQERSVDQQIDAARGYAQAHGLIQELTFTDADRLDSTTASHDAVLLKNAHPLGNSGIWWFPIRLPVAVVRQSPHTQFLVSILERMCIFSQDRR